MAPPTQPRPATEDQAPWASLQTLSATAQSSSQSSSHPAPRRLPPSSPRCDWVSLQTAPGSPARSLAREGRAQPVLLTVMPRPVAGAPERWRANTGVGAFLARPHPGCRVQRKDGLWGQDARGRGGHSPGRREGAEPVLRQPAWAQGSRPHSPRPGLQRLRLRAPRRPGQPPGARLRAPPAAAGCGSPHWPWPPALRAQSLIPHALPRGAPCPPVPGRSSCPLCSLDAWPGLAVQCRGGTRWVFTLTNVGVRRAPRSSSGRMNESGRDGIRLGFPLPLLTRTGPGLSQPPFPVKPGPPRRQLLGPRAGPGLAPRVFEVNPGEHHLRGNMLALLSELSPCPTPAPRRVGCYPMKGEGRPPVPHGGGGRPAVRLLCRHVCGGCDLAMTDGHCPGQRALRWEAREQGPHHGPPAAAETPTVRGSWAFPEARARAARMGPARCDSAPLAGGCRREQEVACSAGGNLALRKSPAHARLPCAKTRVSASRKDGLRRR